MPVLVFVDIIISLIYWILYGIQKKSQLLKSGGASIFPIYGFPHLFRIAVEAIIDSQWWESGFRGENGHHCYIFRDLVREHPELAHKAQDMCIKKPFDPCDPNAVTTYNFIFYEDNYYVPTGVYICASSVYNTVLCSLVSCQIRREMCELQNFDVLDLGSCNCISFRPSCGLSSVMPAPCLLWVELSIYTVITYPLHAVKCCS